MAEGAKGQLQEELGDGFEDLDWKKLDPRQYDPRRIIREALAEEGAPASTLDITKAKIRTQPKLEKGEQAPFDSEAT